MAIFSYLHVFLLQAALNYLGNARASRDDANLLIGATVLLYSGLAVSIPLYYFAIAPRAI